MGRESHYSWYLNFFQRVPPYNKKMAEILACGWSVQVNPGFLLAEILHFTKNSKYYPIPNHQSLK